MDAESPHSDTPAWSAAVLESRATDRRARPLLTLPYWWSGLDKAGHPQAALAETATLLGTSAPLPFYMVLLVVQLGGSLLVISGRLAWLGAGALGVFTLVATVLGHAFWSLDGVARAAATSTFMEHLALVAGLAFAAMRANAKPGSAFLPSRH